jgi:hypothetical protein
MMIKFLRSFCLFLILSQICFLLSLPSSSFAAAGSGVKETEVNQDGILMLVELRYNDLEIYYSDLLKQYANGIISADELAVKFAVFEKASGLELRFDQWVDNFPNSYSARLARGISRIREAWDKRRNMTVSGLHI